MSDAQWMQDMTRNGAQWYRDMAERYEDVARTATSPDMRDANLAEARRYEAIADRLEGRP